MNTVKAIIEYHVAPVLIESGEDSTIRIIDKEFDISSAPWTPEEVAVLVGLSDAGWNKIYIDHYNAEQAMLVRGRRPPLFSAYLRSHIQAEIAKRSE